MTGISGKLFLFLSLVVLAGLFATGSIALGAPGAVVTTTITNLPHYIVEVVVKFVTWFVASGVLAVIVFSVVLDTPIRDLWVWLNAPRNDSHAIVLAGMAGVVSIAMLAAQGVTLQQFAFTVMTKGAIGLFLGILATTAGAWFIGVRSMDNFRARLVEKDNNSHVIVVMAILNIAMAFAMLA